MLRIPETELAKAVGHARQVYPEECCGFLIGVRDGGRDVLEARPAANVQPDHRETRYSVDPRQQLRVELELRGTDREILGFYHSHPDHPGTPSQFDMERSWPEYTYVIIEVRDSRPLGARAFRLDREEGRITEERLVVLTATASAPKKARRSKRAEALRSRAARGSPRRRKPATRGL